MLDNTGETGWTLIQCREQVCCFKHELYPEYPLLRGDILDKEIEE